MLQLLHHRLQRYGCSRTRPVQLPARPGCCCQQGSREQCKACPAVIRQPSLSRLLPELLQAGQPPHPERQHGGRYYTSCCINTKNNIKHNEIACSYSCKQSGGPSVQRQLLYRGNQQAPAQNQNKQAAVLAQLRHSAGKHPCSIPGNPCRISSKPVRAFISVAGNVPGQGNQDKL
ncbi:hypothetical protein D3C80_1411390 [compost metagenome]